MVADDDFIGRNSGPRYGRVLHTPRVVDFVTFGDFVQSLAQPAVRAGREIPAFGVAGKAPQFVEPLLTAYEQNTNANITFVSARGATGKSILAEQLSHSLNAPLWALHDDKAVSGDALGARLSRYFDELDPLSAVGQMQDPLLIVDSMDEARLRVTGLSWDEFMDSLVQYARAGLRIVILGRKRTIEDVWLTVGDSDLVISWFEISHFDEPRQTAYVDLRALRKQTDSELYRSARDAVLSEINEPVDGVRDRTFSGYAPVLDAVATLVSPGANFQALISSFGQSSAGGPRLRTLTKIVEELLARDQVKVAPLARDLQIPSVAFSPEEQLDWLAHEMFEGPEPELGWCPSEKRGEYVDQLRQFRLDHPFRDGGKWASPVFASYVAYRRLSRLNSALLLASVSSSGLFFEFCAQDDSELVVDELQFEALAASLAAGEWADSQSLISLVSPGGSADDAELSAHLTIAQVDARQVQLQATLVLEQPNLLNLRSPLSNVSVDFVGDVRIFASSASIDLGPGVSISARKVLLDGSSLQVSKDYGVRDVSGFSVEIEASEDFQTSAALIGRVNAEDLRIAVPEKKKLAYPWVQFRDTLIDDDDDMGSADPGRRFLSKLMNLARKHGHQGERGVFALKLQGRQALRSEQFQQVISELVQRGVLRVDGNLIFITKEFDEHRFDGKGRPGMTNYDQKANVWGPVAKAISDILAKAESTENGRAKSAAEGSDV